MAVSARPLKRIGLLGGSFDPVHSAHTALAETALRALALDEVQLLPANDPWQRPKLAASPEQRLQLLNFLVMIAQADGIVNPQEIQALKEMAIHMGLSAEDVDQMLNLESGASSTGSLDNAYRVLGISPDASNDEVKAAYRKMALKHQPDKVAALGEDVRRAAEKKFQEINDAKDRIYKARGL